MALRLLKKSEVQTHKNIEHKMDIDEGVKLATKIDNLREILSQEEEALAAFRTKTVAAISSEIDKAQSTLDVLQAEIARLHADRDAGMVVVDERTIGLDRREATLVALGEELNAKIAHLDHRETILEEATACMEKKEKTVELLRAEIELEHSRAKLFTKEQADILATLQLDRHNFNILREDTSRELQRREDTMAAREKRIESRTTELNKRMEELNVREAQLDDRQETLERALKRVK